MSESHPSSPTPARAVGLVLGLVLLGAGLPSIAMASHDIPRVLDQYDVPANGGYAAWHIAVDPPSGKRTADVHLDLGEHARPSVSDGAYTYLGLWVANLDHDYLWFASASTIEMDGADANLHTRDPAVLDRSATVESDWEAWNGGRLSVPEGEWLIVALWATDGQLEAEMTLGSGLDQGAPTVELLNATHGPDVFEHTNRDFGGTTNTYLAADVEDACSIPACLVPRSADVRVIQNGQATETIGHRLFGFFSAPGNIESRADWTGPGINGSQETTYWFHGAPPGTYSFHVRENRDVAPEREPVVAFGADVRLPFDGGTSA